MINWRRRIINTFVKNYFASAPKKGEDRESLRIRSSIFFPDFDSAHPDEKEAYIKAAEILQQKGVAILTWEKDGKGERLRTIRCENFKKLFREAGKPYPQAEVDKTRAMLSARVQALKESLASKNDSSSEITEQANKIIAFLEFLSQNFSLKEIGQGVEPQTMEDLAKLFEFICEPAQLEKATIRTLSILLYQDSKRMETLSALYTPLFLRLQRMTPIPDIPLFGRSYPEVMISGKIIFEYKEKVLSDPAESPLVNSRGFILNLPLETVETFGAISLISGKQERTVLTIENKETFYALGTPQKFGTNENLSRYDCFLFTGGYPSRAVINMIKLLAASGFDFFHAGDLDPDGVLILQQVKDTAERPVTPVRMDAETFNQYRSWGRVLSAPMLRHAGKIRDDTKTIPGIAELLQRIEETGIGIEQEIIDYR
jgi:hypothetical protein